MRKIIYVSSHDSLWKVHSEPGLNPKLFYDKTGAIAHARNMVARLPQEEVAQIKVERGNGTFQAEWTYGRDSFPIIN